MWKLLTYKSSDFGPNETKNKTWAIKIMLNINRQQLSDKKKKHLKDQKYYKSYKQGHLL